MMGQRRRWELVRTGRLMQVDSPADHAAVERWTSDDAVLAALAAIAGVHGERTYNFPALTEAGVRGWTDTAVVVAGAITVGATVSFVRHLRRARDPLVPPALFRDRTFTVVNLVTVLLYGSLGVSFFLVAYQLQVAAGWSALAAGSALLPATVLMFMLSAASGSLAQRIGPRLQLTVGPLLAGAAGPHPTAACGPLRAITTPLDSRECCDEI